jgi:hypothetical protein
MIQVDKLCHRITEYRGMLLAWTASSVSRRTRRAAHPRISRSSRERSQACHCITLRSTCRCCGDAQRLPECRLTASSRCSSTLRPRPNSKTCIRSRAAYSGSSILRTAARARLHLLGPARQTMPSSLQRSRASFCSSLSSRAMQLLECTRIPRSRLVTMRRRRSIYSRDWRASRDHAFEVDHPADWSRSGCLKHDLQGKPNSTSAPRGPYQRRPHMDGVPQCNV